MAISVHVDGADRLEKLANSARFVLSSELDIVAGKLERLVLQEVTTVFRGAFANAGSGFPPIYRRHILDTLENIPVYAEVSGYVIEVSFDLEELGTYDDLSEGFHYGARTKDGGYVELPYQGEELKSTFAKRYAYWRKISKSETYAERVTYWESIGKAPEWLILQYGTTTEPTVRPYPIVEEINASIAAKAYALVEQAIDRANSKAFHEYYEHKSFTSKPALQYLRDPATGRFVGSKKRG